jgi:hypothetical protein
VSAARTANPSIAELSKPGTSSAEVASSASTRPTASPTGTGSAVSRSVRASTRLRASSTEISSFAIGARA